MNAGLGSPDCYVGHWLLEGSCWRRAIVSCAPEADVISQPANGWSLLNPVYPVAPPIKPTSGRPSSFRFWELLARK